MNTDTVREQYFFARERYDTNTFLEVLKVGRLSGANGNTILRDFLAGAGAIYLMELDGQKTKLPRDKVLKALKGAEAAALKLAKNLETILTGDELSAQLVEIATKRQKDMRRVHGEDSDTYEILRAIFPFQESAHGIREEGLTNVVRFLGNALSDIEIDLIEKTPKGRKYALIPWLGALAPIWGLTKGGAIRAGHYHKMFSEHDSSDVAALTLAIQQIDPEVTSRSVAGAITEANKRFRASPTNAAMEYARAMLIICQGGNAHTPVEVWKEWHRCTVPDSFQSDETLERFFSGDSLPSTWNANQAIISKEQFFETLNSSKEGKRLLQALVALSSK